MSQLNTGREDMKSETQRNRGWDEGRREGDAHRIELSVRPREGARDEKKVKSE